MDNRHLNFVAKKRTRFGKHYRSRGYAMLSALSASVIFIMLGSGMLETSRYVTVDAIRGGQKDAAIVAKDAAMAIALKEMNDMLPVKNINNNALPIGAMHLANSEQSLDYQVILDNNTGIYEVFATGESGPFSSQANALLALTGLYEYAIYVKGNITLDNSTTVLPYNMPSGAPKLDIATRSTNPDAISLYNSATVYGNLHVGVGGDPAVGIDRYSSVTITGEQSALEWDWIPPDVVVPTYLLQAASSGNIKNDKTVSTDGKWDYITLGNSEIVTVNGDVTLYVTGDISLGNSATFEYANKNSSLTLYVGGDIEFKNSGGANDNYKNARNFTILALPTCGEIRMNNSGKIYGTIYAPDAIFELDNSTEIHGAVVGKSYYQKNSSTLYYDASLRNTETDDIGAVFTPSYWSE